MAGLAGNEVRKSLANAIYRLSIWPVTQHAAFQLRKMYVLLQCAGFCWDVSVRMETV